MTEILKNNNQAIETKANQQQQSLKTLLPKAHQYHTGISFSIIHEFLLQVLYRDLRLVFSLFYNLLCILQTASV